MPNDVRIAVQNHQKIKADLLGLYPDLAEDDPALLDTLEGESNIDRVIAALINEALTREALASGLSGYIKQMQDRRSRLTAGAEKLRSMALWAMQEVGLEKLSEPAFLASLGKSPPAVVVIDETVIPESYFRVKREPDKTEIGRALKDGQDVPGCTLGNRRATLTVRTT